MKRGEAMPPNARYCYLTGPLLAFLVLRAPFVADAQPSAAVSSGVDAPHYAELPSATDVIQRTKGSDAKDSALRQIARLQLLKLYISQMTGLDWIDFSLMPNLISQKWREYEEAVLKVSNAAGISIHGVNPYVGDEYKQKVEQSMPKGCQLELGRARKGAPHPEVNRRYLVPLPQVRDLMKSMRSSDDEETRNRQLAALTLMMDYVLVVSEVEPWYARHQPEYRMYEQERNALINTARSLAPHPYLESPEFHVQLLRAVSPEGRKAYWSVRSPTRREPTFKSAAEDQRYAQQKSRARSNGLDLRVFEIELYSPLDLPKCPDGSAFGTSVLSGVGVGSEKTCSGGDPALDMGATIFSVLEGIAGETPPYNDVPIQLAGSSCPSWVKASGQCVMSAQLVDGYVLGVTVFTGSRGTAPDEVVAQLDRKYGTRGRAAGKTITCRDADTSAVTYEGPQLVWPVDGLDVKYWPVNYGCQIGMIKVRTPELMHLLKTHRAKDPEM